MKFYKGQTTHSSLNVKQPDVISSPWQTMITHELSSATSIAAKSALFPSESSTPEKPDGRHESALHHYRSMIYCKTMKINSMTCSLSRIALTALSFLMGSLAVAQNTTQQAFIPVTSYRIDIQDDPEYLHSEAPILDWKVFGDRMRLITRFHNNIADYRAFMGDSFVVDTVMTGDFPVPIPWPWLHEAVTGFKMGSAITKPPCPVILKASLGKEIYGPGEGESAVSHSINDIRNFQRAYPNTIYAGGRMDEADDMLWWTHYSYYERRPVSNGQNAFPAVFQDNLEAASKRGAVPYMYFQHNAHWAMPYTANARISSIMDAQIMARDGHTILPQFAQVRSVNRQHPGAFGIQVSGQMDLAVANLDQVINQGATPTWKLNPNDTGETRQYAKSYALSRQLLYYSWLNGARFFR